MNVNLIRAIHLSHLRIEPAVKKQNELHPEKERFMRYFRVLSPVMEIPLKVNFNKEWYLDGTIAPQTKTGDAYREMVAAGIKLDSIWHRKLSSIGFYNKLLRALFHLQLVFGLLIQRRRAIRKLDLAGIQVLIGYAAYKRFFKVHPRLKPIIISDISPFLHMQWAGALAAGNKVMWWQDDYHHFKGFSSENYLPYPCHYAAVLNERGFITAKEICFAGSIFKRKETAVKPLRPIPDKPKVGFASNVLFRADDQQLENLNEIRVRLGVNEMYCRLHPNSKLHGTKNHPSWLCFAPKEENLLDFSRKVDLVVVGNSAVQLKLLCEGVPVVHVSGFDEMGFDLYQYCRLGLAAGFKNLGELNLDDIRVFYNNEKIAMKLSNYVNVKSELRSLQELPKPLNVN